MNVSVRADVSIQKIHMAHLAELERGCALQMITNMAETTLQHTRHNYQPNSILQGLSQRLDTES
eukprot:m.49647 g.49647  ORF g.49647 m.49647 type:complete len:64 (-) comp15336_c0_seq2:6-197(-)